MEIEEEGNLLNLNETFLNSIRKFSGGRGGNPNRGMGRFNSDGPRRNFRGRNNQRLGNVNLIKSTN